MDNGCRVQFRRRRLGEDKFPVQLASAKGFCVATETARNQPNPHPFQVTKQTIIPKPVVYLDEVKRLLDTMQDGLGRDVHEHPDPQTINPSAGGETKREPVDEPRTLGSGLYSAHEVMPGTQTRLPRARAIAALSSPP